MATIRKRKNKYQVQVRRKDSPQVSKTFICYKDAKKWARETEIKLDQNFIQFTEDPYSLTLQSLIKKYIKEVIVHKKSYKIETIILKSFLAGQTSHLIFFRKQFFFTYRYLSNILVFKIWPNSISSFF